MGLGVGGGNWYLVGHDESRDDVRNFRLDRIRGRVSMADRQDGAYEVPEGFDASRHIGTEEFEIAEGPEVAVVLELDPTATWLMERRRHGVGTLTRLDDGRGRFEVIVRSEEGLFRWLAEYGQRARIVSPERLARAWQERIDETRALYADVPPSA